MILRHGLRLRFRAYVSFLCVVFGEAAVLACGGGNTERGFNKQSQSGGTSAVGLGGSSSVLGSSGNSGGAVGGKAAAGIGATPGHSGGGGSSAAGGSFSASGGSLSGGAGSGGVANAAGGVASASGGTPAGLNASCNGLPPTCGPQETEDCCASPLLPGGMFYRGENTDNGAPATLSPFRLDRFEVTVGRYRRFVEAYDAWRSAGHPNANEGAHPNAPGTGWDPAWDSELAILAPNAATLRQNLACSAAGNNTWSDAPGAHETRPIGCVNWYQSFAFCIWDGGYLPTEAEFNFAQTGGDERRYLPWSSPPSAQQYDRKYASFECGIENGLEDCIFRVGAHPLGDGRFGQADLGGNVWEWTLDYEVEYPTPCQDCTSMLDPGGPASEGRIMRGGGWANGSSGMRVGYRIGHNPQSMRVGFRCARNP